MREELQVDRRPDEPRNICEELQVDRDGGRNDIGPARVPPRADPKMRRT
jgi:hypothetical protein